MTTQDEEKRNAEFALLVRQLRDSLPGHLELCNIRAVLMRRFYLALVAQGFTVEQAVYFTTEYERRLPV